MKIKNVILLGLILAVSTLISTAQNAPSPTSRPQVQPGPAAKLTPQQRTERQQKVLALVMELRAKRSNGTLSTNEKAWLELMEETGSFAVNSVPRGGVQKSGLRPRNATGPRAQMGLCPPYANYQAGWARPSWGANRGPRLGQNQPGWARPSWDTYRGPRLGQNWAGGRGRRGDVGFGLRDGTGPRSQMGLCPLVPNAPATRVAPPSGMNRNPGFGRGWGGGRGRGMGGGYGGYGGYGPRNGTGPRAQAGICPWVDTPPGN